MLFLLSLTLADLQNCSKLYPLSQTLGAATKRQIFIMQLLSVQQLQV